MIKFIKDNLFPIFCVNCAAEGEAWCKNCRQQFIVSGVFFCPVCELPSDFGKIHFACGRADFYLDGLLALSPYLDNSSLARLVKQLKYHFAVDNIDWIKEILRQWLAFNYERARGIFSGRIIMPVPLHSRRLRERGFNQAELLARGLWTVLVESGLIADVNCALERVRYTSAQAQLSGNARRKNMTAAFKWPDGVSCPPEIILVDDVYTTGATMNAAAGALKAVGARSVWGFALLHG